LKDATAPILAQLDSLEEPDTDSQRHATELLSLLNAQFVDELVSFDYDLPKPPEKKTGKTKAAAPAKVADKKEPSAISGGDDSQKEPRRAAPRTRSSLAEARREETADLDTQEAEERRRSRTLPGPPVYVKEVDNRSMFKNFESGWILPEGMSRRRTVSVQPPTVKAVSNLKKPPAKKRKTESTAVP
jgi:hypothetical protein